MVVGNGKWILSTAIETVEGHKCHFYSKAETNREWFQMELYRCRGLSVQGYNLEALSCYKGIETSVFDREGFGRRFANGKQKIMFALRSIKGIGRRFANIVCKKADINMSKRSK
ncbi:ribosomal protein S18 [Carex littledalei]|uniref:Ribosomal protein S18 n=1 Tax=Carex littledalei TaxID=544730 RepID=A0A833REU5_9POAL|nr:ribosomal protein S18 [Carex littledalei]